LTALDIIVGGMPRGGTTALAELLCLHPDCYCFSAETHFIPIAHRFLTMAPRPPAARPFVEAEIAREVHFAIGTMLKYNLDLTEDKRHDIILDEDIDDWCRFLSALVMANGDAASGLAEVVARMGRFFRAKTGRPVVGEKTPDNIAAVAAFGPLGSRRVLAVSREPFAVIASLERRAEVAADPSAGSFGGPLHARCGLYVEALSAILAVRGQQRVQLVHYEHLVDGRAERILQQTLEGTGLALTDAFMATTQGFFHSADSPSAIDRFAPDERALIWGLTAPERERAGYGADFYGQPVATSVPSRSGLRGYDLQLYLLSGGQPETHEGQALYRLGGQAHLALHVRRGARSARLRGWSNYPDYVLAEGQSASIAVSRPGSDRPCAIAEVGRGPTWSALELDLADWPPDCILGDIEVRRLTVTSDPVFVPLVTETATRGPDGHPTIHAVDRLPFGFILVADPL
jgi:Sulfotransferase family